jgi:hypothetical protein
MHRFQDSSQLSLAIESNISIGSMKVTNRSVGRTEENLLCDHLSTKSLRKCKEACDTNPITRMRTANTIRSQQNKRSQPILFTRKMSDSDIQLHEDLLVAEYREYCMFRRIRDHNNFGSIATYSKAKVKGQNVDSFEDTRIRFIQSMAEDNFESASPTFMPFLIEESFKGQESDVESSSSMPLPSLLSLMDLLPIAPNREENDDIFDGIFDMEL